MVHHVQHVTLRMRGTGATSDISVCLAGSDLVDRLTPGCEAVVLVQMSPIVEQGSVLGPCRILMQPRVLNAMVLSMPAKRASQLQCTAALAACFAETAAPTWQELLELVAQAAGIVGHGSMNWYTLLAALMSAVTVGEDHRDAKVPGFRSHRCQV